MAKAKTKTSGIILAATAAALFATGAIATVTSPVLAVEGVKCAGINACKGQGECAGASNACAGQNACKAQGWVSRPDATACEAEGGSVIEG